ncbi:MAG: RluA family pseudouridine synthase [Ruminococcus sp.]|jgi:23S rRNA pseudouridine955/2504/2580 synthase|nr:RluA family pseudouridine synthase [Ruminococcus sp.]
MKEVTAAENDVGQRLDKFLTKTFPELPKGMLYKAIRKKDIKINGKRAKEDTIIQLHDNIKIYINDEFLVKKTAKLYESGNIDVIYEDENILLINKPSGLVVHEDNEGSTDTLADRLLFYLNKKGEYNPEDEHSFAPALCNRLDRNTSGIVIAAKNASSLRILNEKIKHREISKYYLCITVGIPQKSHDILTAYHIKNENEKLVKIFDKPVPGSKKIITEYTVVKTYPEKNLALIRVHLITGRTHQIRAHLAFIGYPVLGDGKYGIGEVNRKFHVKTQCLHAYKLRFEFEDTALGYLYGKEFETPPPWFEDFL